MMQNFAHHEKQFNLKIAVLVCATTNSYGRKSNATKTQCIKHRYFFSILEFFSGLVYCL